MHAGRFSEAAAGRYSLRWLKLSCSIHSAQQPSNPVGCDVFFKAKEVLMQTTLKPSSLKKFKKKCGVLCNKLLLHKTGYHIFKLVLETEGRALFFKKP